MLGGCAGRHLQEAILHGEQLSSGLRCVGLSSGHVPLICLSFAAGGASAGAAHILDPPEVVSARQQHPIAVQLQAVSSAFLRKSQNARL